MHVFLEHTVYLENLLRPDLGIYQSHPQLPAWLFTDKGPMTLRFYKILDFCYAQPRTGGLKLTK